MALHLENPMRDSFLPPQDKQHAPTYEPLHLEAPAPSYLEPHPRHASPDDSDEDEERERVIIIDI